MVNEMVAANSVTVAVATGANHFQLVVAQSDAGCNRQCAAMKRVHSVSVDVTGQIRRTADAADDAGLMRLLLQLEQRPLKRDEHGEIAAAGTPIRMDAAAVSLLRELGGFGGNGWCNGRVHGSLGVNFMDRNGKTGLASQLLFHCFDNVVGHKRLAVVLADMTVRIETGFASEITGELAALIVLN